MKKSISRRLLLKSLLASIALGGLASILHLQNAPAYIKPKNYNILLILNDQERAWPYIPKSIDLPARRYLENISTYFNRSIPQHQYVHLHVALFIRGNMFNLLEYGIIL